MTATISSYSFGRIGSLLGISSHLTHSSEETSPSSDGWYIPYNDNTQRNRQSRARATSAASPPSFISFDGGAGAIGESPRSSYRPTSHHHHHTAGRERSSFGSILHFGSPNRHSQYSQHQRSPISEASSPTLASTLGQGLGIKIPETQPLRPRAKSSPQRPISGATTRSKSFSNAGVHSGIGIDKSTSAPPLPPKPHVAPNLIIKPPHPPPHPYAVARSPPTPGTPISAPIVTYPNQQPLPPATAHTLRSTTSTPNLRKTTSFGKLRPKKPITLIAETWCDALLFPRPRLRAHQLSITPPITPDTPNPPLLAQHLKPLNPDNPDAASITSYHDALAKALKEGEKRDKEKEEWQNIAANSFQNSRSRSLSRSRRRARPKEESLTPKDNSTGVKRGIEILAESAFSQGAPSVTVSGGSNSTASHSRNTSITTDKSRHNIVSRNPVPKFDKSEMPGGGRVRGGEVGLAGALSNPGQTTKLYVTLPPVVDSPAFVNVTSRPPPLPPVVRNPSPVDGPAVTGSERSSDSPSLVGVAISTPTNESVPLSFASHPYASPNLSMSKLPAVSNSNPSGVMRSDAPVPPSLDVTSRQRVPPRSAAPVTHPYTSPDLTLRALPPTSVAPDLPSPTLPVRRKVVPPVTSEIPPQLDTLQRRSLLGAYAYALSSNGPDDDTLLGMEEALRRTMKRRSADSIPATSDNNSTPIAVSAPAPPLPSTQDPMPPVTMTPVKTTPPPVRYEPVKFEPTPGPSRLSTIEDVPTPPSTMSPGTASSILSKVTTPMEAEPGDQSKDSLPSIPTSDSSPASESGPRVLDDNDDDPEQYRNLFYQLSPPASPSVRLSDRASYAPTMATGSSAGLEERRSMKSLKSIEGLRGLRRKLSEDFNLPITPTPRIPRLHSADQSSFPTLHAVPEFAHATDDEPMSGQNATLSTQPVADDHEVNQTPTAESHAREPLSSSPDKEFELPVLQLEFDAPDIPEDIPSSRASSPLGTTEENLDFTIQNVDRASLPSVTDATSRPMSTHLNESDRGDSGDLTDRLRPDSLPVDAARQSSYSAETNESRMSNIISDFPSPPDPTPGSDFATPSTLLDGYFTATDNTPGISRRESPEDTRRPIPDIRQQYLDGYFTTTTNTPGVSRENLHIPTPSLRRELTENTYFTATENDSAFESVDNLGQSMPSSSQGDLLHTYFTASDSTPLQSREELRQTMPTSLRGSLGTVSGFTSEEALMTPSTHPISRQ